MFSKKVLIFYHIAKTGGVTLDSILRRHYSAKESVFLNYGIDPDCVQRLKDLAESEKREIKYLHAHMVPLDTLDLFMSPVSIVFFRHPVDRVVSEYYYIKRTVEHPLYHIFQQQNVTLQDYVEGDLNRGAVQNGQTRLLSGITGADWVTGSADLHDSALDLAKKNLEKYSFLIGLTERFDEFLILFKYVFGWQFQDLLYRRLNVKSKRSKSLSIPSELLYQIELRNQLDLELYHYASEQFDRLTQRNVTNLRVKILYFKWLNVAFNSKFSVGHLIRQKKIPVL